MIHRYTLPFEVRLRSRLMKTKIAIFFGGRSPEHDVSIVTGLQALDALDRARFDPFPVYIAPDGVWWIGDALRRRENYLPDGALKRSLRRVTLELNPSGGGGRLIDITGSGWRGRFRRPAMIFDVAIPALHGPFGEDGCLQGVFEAAGIAYTGMRLPASAILMDKGLTKRILAAADIPQLPWSRVLRPQSGGLIPDQGALQAIFSDGLSFPLIVKPMHLGSSIGVARVTDMESLRAALAVIFRFDDQALAEPCVEPLIEYNLAVADFGGDIITSAIERPKHSAELLDFRAKYLSGDGKKGGVKAPGQTSEGMLSLTRELNPKLDAVMEEKLRDYARRCFEIVNGTGAPRIDFLIHADRGDIWLNEVNPMPGSFGYFLWQAASRPTLFTALLTRLIDEALMLHRRSNLPADPTHPEARLFKRPDES